jgi:hypothetical protein
MVLTVAKCVYVISVAPLVVSSNLTESNVSKYRLHEVYRITTKDTNVIPLHKLFLATCDCDTRIVLHRELPLHVKRGTQNCETV